MSEINIKEYLPYGQEWEKMMKRKTKKQLIQFIKEQLKKQK